MTNLKSKLLAAKKRKPVAVTIFGEVYQITRLSAARIAAHENKMSKVSTSPDKVLNLTCDLILESIIDETGKPAKANTTPSELLEVYCPAELIEAMEVITKANFDLTEAKNV